MQTQTHAQQCPAVDGFGCHCDEYTNTAADLLAATVDRLADIKAQIAALQAEEEELKNDLTESGAAAIEGTLHRAAITYGSTRTTTDWQAVAQHLKPSRQLIKAHTTTGQPFDIVRIGAKKTS
jgi:N-methylhydantoinase B/oxoprolinase/acetone carboxylase alpha subunit